MDNMENKKDFKNNGSKPNNNFNKNRNQSFRKDAPTNKPVINQDGKPVRFNKENGEGNKPLNKDGQNNRPYNKDGQNNRPFNKDGQNKPYNKDGQAKPFNKDGQAKPFNKEGKKKPYNKDGQAKPFNKEGQNNRPFNKDGQAKPFNKDGQNKPFNKDGQNRPQRNQGQRPPYLKDEDREVKPNSFGKKPAKSKTDQMIGKLDLAPAEKSSNFKQRSKIDLEKKLKKEESFDKDADLLLKKQTKKVKKVEEAVSKLVFSDGMTLSEVAEELKLTPSAILMKFMGLGYIMNLNSVVTREQAEMLCLELNIEYELQKLTDLMRFDEFEIEDSEDELVKRPPIVTIMGHVDHGKTTLLDTIRNSRVVKGEAGGITQHIGAYQVERNGEKITFIDTPGHAAFTEMRARGAQVTDIVILVVAADDGVMPQTEEAISHAKQAGVPIIVAVNKCDKPQANPDRVMQELSNFDLIPEEWGGKTIYCQVSALKGEGIDNLLDMVQLLADVENYQANPNRLASGTVIEAKMDKGRGNVATIIVQTGTLKVGDCIVIGNVFAKIRTMTDDLNRKFKEAGPSTAVEITGLDGTPHAGDKFLVFEDEREAKNIASKRLHKAWVEEKGMSKAVSLESMFSDIKEGEKKHLNILVKADTQGSCEAIKSSLEKLSNEEVSVSIVRCSVGAISDEDVNLALVSNAIIVGFNIRPTANVRETAKTKNVEIRFYNIIYKMIEEITQAVKGMLKPVYEEVVTGQAQVRELFVVSKVGTIAGCYVTDGVIERNSLVRVLRNGAVVYEGKLKSLKRFKDDVKEVKYGYDCGMMIEGFNDLKMDDIIEASVMKEVER